MFSSSFCIILQLILASHRTLYVHGAERLCPQGPIAPDCTKLPNGSFATDTVDCNKYYVCRNGFAVSHRCEKGLWFDGSRKVCNFPLLVDCPKNGCQQEITSTVSTTLTSTRHACPTGPTSPDCTKLPSGSFVTDTIDCNKYYTCRNGEAVPSRCQSGLWFDDLRNVCNFPQLVNCPNFGCQPETTPSTPPSTPTQSQTDPSTDSTTSPSDSTPTAPNTDTPTTPSTEPSTPTQSQTDPSTDSTISPSDSTPTAPNTDTPTKPSTEPSTPTQSQTGHPCPTGPTAPDCTKLPSGSFVTDTIDCNKYYTCRNGEAVPSRCQSGLWFDDLRNVCNFPQLVNCPNFGCQPETTPSTPPSTPTQSQTDPSTDSTISPSDSTPTAPNTDTPTTPSTEPSTPTQSQTDPSTDSTISPSDSTPTAPNTDTPTKPSTEPSTPTQSQTGHPCPTGPTAPDCTKLPSGSFVTDTIDCNKYYTCRNGEAVPSRCQSGLWFDDLRNVCNFPQLVNCPNFGCQPETTPSTPPSTPTQSQTDPSTDSTISPSDSTPTAPNTDTPTTPSTEPSTPTQSQTGHPCPTGPTAPDCTKLPSGSFVTDTIDCNKYYTCRNGEAVPSRCQSGLWFDDLRNVCNFPQLVNCPNFGCQQTTPSTPPSTPTQSQTDPSTDSTNSPSDSTPTAPNTDTPTTPSTEPSTPTQSQTGHPCPTGPTAPDCTKLPSGSFVTDTIDCNKYYTCRNGEAVPSRCQSGLWFDDLRNVCNFPQLVNCPNFGCQPETTPSTPPSTPTQSQTDPSTDSTTSPSDSTPTAPNTDTPTTPSTEPSTPTQSQTDPSTDSTISPSDSTPTAPNTDTPTTPSTEPSTPTQSQTGHPCPTGPTAPDCTKLPSGSFVTDTIDCNKYYTCRNGGAVPSRCQSGLWFDDLRNVCNFPQLVNCPNFGCQPETTPSTPLSTPTQSQTDPSTDSTISPSDSTPTAPNTDTPTTPSTEPSTPTQSQTDPSTDSTISPSDSTPTAPNTDTPTTPSTEPSTPTQSQTGHPCPTGPTAPDCTKLPSGSFVTDTIDCNKYYTCRNGEAVPSRCQSGLWFDDQKFVCNFPQLVNCPNFGCQPETTPSTPPSTPTQSQTDPSTDSTISPSDSTPTAPNTDTPTKPSTEPSTPTQSQTDPSTDSTISPSDSTPTTPNTDTPTTPSTEPSTPTQSQTGHPCPTGPTAPDCTKLPSGSFVTDTIDCNKYYTCRNGEAVPSRCQSGLWFDDLRNVCNFPQLVNCPNFGCQPETTPSTPPSTPTQSQTDPSTDSTNSPSDSTPTAPNTDTPTTPSTEPSTPTQSQTDPSTDSTISPSDSTPTTPNTDTPTTPSTEPSTPTQSQTGHPCPTGPTAPDCTKLPSGSFVTDTIDCNKYYTCRNGEAVPSRCQSGLWFDDLRNVCNFPQLVNCPNFGCQPETTPSTEPSTPTQSQTDPSTDSTISPSDSTPTAPNTDTPTKPSTEPSTPTQSQTDPSTDSTISPSDSTPTAPNTDTPTKPSTEPSTPTQSQTGHPCPTGPTAPDCTKLPSGSFVTDIIDCNKYYTCRNGEAVPSRCQSGLWFDDLRNVCNFPQLVNCPNFGCQPETTPSTPPSTPTQSQTDPSTDSTNSPSDSTPTAPNTDTPTTPSTEPSTPTQSQTDPSTDSTISPSDSTPTTPNTDTPTTPSTEPSTPTQSQTGHPCPTGPTAPDCTKLPSGSFVTDTIDCNKYYTCRNGEAVPSRCQSGLWFDDLRNVCNFPQLVNCPNFGCQPETTPSTPPSTPTQSQTDPSTDSTNSPSDSTPTAPNTDTPTTPSTEPSTPTQSQTDPSTDSTISPSDSTPTAPNTDTPTTPSTEPSTPTQSQTGHPCPTGPTAPDCTKLPSGSFVTDTIDCNKYYTCRNGRAVGWRCQAGLWFDDKRFVCHFPEFVDCPNNGCKPN